MSHFPINLGQTAEDSDMFTNILLSSIGLTVLGPVFESKAATSNSGNGVGRG